MKIKNLLIVAFLFVTSALLADCAPSGMQFFPQQKEISLRSIFIIEGYGESQKTIQSFKTRKIFLKSDDGQSVELILVEILKGQMGLTQGVFKPAEKLKPNTKYFLKYTNATQKELEEMYNWNSKSGQRETVYWQTLDVEFIQKPNSSPRIEFEKNEVEHYGCGPSANAIFKIANPDKSETWYMTEVVELATKRKTTFYILASGNKLNVGHGMCSGAFTFARTGKYQVRFTPMNSDGEKSTPTGWKIFGSPYLIVKRI